MMVTSICNNQLHFLILGQSEGHPAPPPLCAAHRAVLLAWERVHAPLPGKLAVDPSGPQPTQVSLEEHVGVDMLISESLTLNPLVI